MSLIAMWTLIVIVSLSTKIETFLFVKTPYKKPEIICDSQKSIIDSYSVL